MRKKIFLFTIMTIVLAVLLSFNVLAELQFTTNVTINDNIINDKNEEFYLTVSASNLPSEGLLSAQYYIEYDNTVFSVETDENAGSISQNSIEYKQNRSNNFFNSVNVSGNKTKLIILYYDNSNNLDQPLHDGDLFKIKFKYIGNNTGSYKINVSGEGFSTIQNDDIIKMSSTINNVSLTVRDKSINFFGLSYGSNIYNGKVNSFTAKIKTTDFEENTVLSFNITRETYYGDINFDGDINTNDKDILTKYINKEISLSDLQQKVADINKDGNINNTDNTALENCINSSGEKYNCGNVYSTQDALSQFDITNNKVGNVSEGISSFDVNLKTKNTIEVGTYIIKAKINNIESSTKKINIKGQPVEQINIDSSYTVAENNSINITPTVLPNSAIVKSVKYSIKDENIAEVDQSGRVTGLEQGKTELYVTSMDGTEIKSTAEINVVSKSIIIDNVQYTPLKKYDNQNKLYDKDGGNIEARVNFKNTDASNLSYSLTKNNSNTNLINKVSVQITPNDNAYNLSINIPPNTLENGTYMFKISNSDNVTSNIIEIEINEFIPISSVNVKYNNENITNLNILNGDQVDLTAEILPTEATNKELKWKVSSNLTIINDSSNVDRTIKATSKGSGTIEISDTEDKVLKTINVNVIESVLNEANTTKESTIGNEEIDEKFGGSFKTIIKLTNAKDEESIKVKLYSSSNEEVSSEKYELITNNVKSNTATITIKVGNNKLTKGEYKVKYEYTQDDIKNTKKEGEYTIELNEFIPITNINTNIESIIVMKDKEYTIVSSILPDNATYKNIVFESDNENISIANNKIIAQHVGDSIVTIKSQDGSNINKQINVKVVDTDISSNIFTIDYKNNKISKVNDKLKLKNFETKLNKASDLVLKAYKNNKEIDYENDFIGTGTVLKTYLNDEEINNYTIIVDGDIDGLGDINATDVLYVKLHILTTKLLDGIYFEAADIDKNNCLNAIDVLYMKRYILKITDNVWGK